MIRITAINYYSETKIVKSINWEFNNISGVLELPIPNDNNFIPLENLTNEILLSWTNSRIDTSQFFFEEILNENEIKSIIL